MVNLHLKRDMQISSMINLDINKILVLSVDCYSNYCIASHF